MRSVDSSLEELVCMKGLEGERGVREIFLLFLRFGKPGHIYMLRGGVFSEGKPGSTEYRSEN